MAPQLSRHCIQSGFAASFIAHDGRIVGVGLVDDDANRRVVAADLDGQIVGALAQALNVPQVHLDGHHLATGERELQLRLELPGGPISMLVIPRRYERLEEAELGCTYLLGVHISQMDDEDRRCYLSFVAQGLEGKL